MKKHDIRAVLALTAITSLVLFIGLVLPIAASMLQDGQIVGSFHRRESTLEEDVSVEEGEALIRKIGFLRDSKGIPLTGGNFYDEEAAGEHCKEEIKELAAIGAMPGKYGEASWSGYSAAPMLYMGQGREDAAVILWYIIWKNESFYFEGYMDDETGKIITFYAADTSEESSALSEEQLLAYAGYMETEAQMPGEQLTFEKMGGNSFMPQLSENRVLQQYQYTFTNGKEKEKIRLIRTQYGVAYAPAAFE